MPSIHPTVKQLMIIRGLRSFGQGMMVVDLTLYLATLHWSGAAIGGVLTAAGLFGAFLILGVGILSDTIGRKPFLILAESLALISAGGATLTTNPIFLTLAIVLAGFGRGQSGAAGPFAPAEQAWLAQLVAPENRGRVFSRNTAIGFLGMGLGALAGGTPHILRYYLSGPASFRPIFLFITIVSLICLIMIIKLPADREKNKEKGGRFEGKDLEHKGDNVQVEKTTNRVTISPKGEEAETVIRKQENRDLRKLAFVNMMNGLAIGLTGPLMAYWFSIKFGVGTGKVGITLSLSFLLTSVSSIFTGYLTERFGLIRSVTILRLTGVVLMFALPFSPTFIIASVIYIVRNALNRGTQGARSALNSSLTRDNRRGLASSVGAVAMRLPASIGPTISGALLDAQMFVLPFILSSSLQLLYAYFYQSFFKSFNYKKAEQK